ncbi:hypothetical protein AB4Z29_25295 [Paenibacillus sp. 2TAB23]|uniref:hypothetical protein n=1 Tax=Paenibacillus sp. 2TAB23 TaxID=3233004 RepID=UPI003F9913B4
MQIPNIQTVINRVAKKYNCSLFSITRKKIMFHGVSNGKKLVLCSPESKLHVKGHGWFDLTTKQVELLIEADIAILAVRLEENKIYFVDFNELRNLLFNAKTLNYSSDEKWRLYIWNNYITIRGNAAKFSVDYVTL